MYKGASVTTNTQRNPERNIQHSRLTHSLSLTGGTQQQEEEKASFACFQGGQATGYKRANSGTCTNHDIQCKAIAMVQVNC